VVDNELIGFVASGLCGVYDRRKVRQAYQCAAYGERLYGYQEVVFHAGMCLFRWYEAGVYYHNGKVWCRLEDYILEYAVKNSLSSSGVPKSDLVKCSYALVRSLKDGAKTSPLLVSPSVIGFRNGVWDFSDLDNPIYHPFTDRMPVLELLPYDYDVTAGCPAWCAFLESVLGKTEIHTLQKYLGLGCVDRRSMSHKIEETLWLIGNGANGKSVVFDVVRSVYGANNISYMGLDTLLSPSTEVRARFIGGMVGKIFNYCSEVQAEDISRHSDVFKSLCSGEPQTVRRLGQNPETATAIPYLIFNMNRRPKDRFMDHALLRRLLFVHFKATVKLSDMNRGLAADLLSELSGIRNWMMEGYRMLVRDNYRFGVVDASDEEMTDYMLENGQSVQVYLNSSAIRPNRYVGHKEEKPQWALSTVLYQDYVSYCHKWAIEPITQRIFGSELVRLGFSRKRTSSGYVYEVFSEVKLSFGLKI